MFTRNDKREVYFTLVSFAKRSKDIQIQHHNYDGVAIRIKPNRYNSNIIAEMIDALALFDWWEVEDLQESEFYKYDEIWYHSLLTTREPRDDEIEKYERVPFYDVVLNFEFEEED